MRPGVLIVSHYRLGEEMLQALRLIMPETRGFHTISVTPGQGAPELRQAFEQALAQADQGGGVLVLTDMFGGTPANMSLSYLGERNLEVVTGFNLPMLIKLAEMQDSLPLPELARLVKDYGQRNISLASELLLPDADA